MRRVFPGCLCLFPLHKGMRGLGGMPGLWGGDRGQGEVENDTQTPNAITTSLECSQGVGCSKASWVESSSLQPKPSPASKVQKGGQTISQQLGGQ